MFALAGCEKNDLFYDPIPPYSETEKRIRLEFDNQAAFYWTDYQMLLEKLSEEKFIVLPLNEMRKHYSSDKVVVGLRHDIDFNPFKGLEMAEMEKSYGIRATYFILATAKYYGQVFNHGVMRNIGMDTLYKRISNRAGEIGIHNDLLTVMMEYGQNPFTFNMQEMEFYRSIGIKIHGTAAHGSPIAKVTVPNYQIFSDFVKKDSVEYYGKWHHLGIKSLYEFGYEYESTFIDYNIYLSDSGGKWNDMDGFQGILNRLDDAKPGTRVQILVHPDWWGRTW